MKFAAPGPCADPEKATHRIIEIAIVLTNDKLETIAEAPVIVTIAAVGWLVSG